MEQKITADMKVSEVLDKYPETLNAFIKQGTGFKALTSPKLRKLFAGLVTVRQAARIHGVDVDKLVRDLNAVIEKRG